MMQNYRVRSNIKINHTPDMVARAFNLSFWESRQEDYCVFKVSLGYRVRYCLTKTKQNCNHIEDLTFY